MTTVRSLVTTWGFEINDAPLKRLDSGIAKVQTGISRMANGARKLGYLFTGNAFGLGLIFKQMSDFEQVDIAFETMIGNVELAKKTIADLKSFARRTPFNFKGVVESSKRLLAFGFQAADLIPTMTALGNIASGVGREKLPNLILALGQVRAAGKLTGMELRQFTEAGVPLLEELSKTTGKSTAQLRDMISSGAISFEHVRQALFSMSAEGGRFNNLMAKQSRSLGGLFSNLIDFIQILIDDVGKRGLLGEAKAVLNNVINFLQRNRKEVVEKVAAIINASIRLMKDLGSIIMTMWRTFEGLARVVGGTERALKLLGLTMAFLVSAKLLMGLGGMVQGIYQMVMAVRLLGNSALIANAKIAAIPLLIGAAIVAIALILEDVYAFLDGKKSITGLLLEKLKGDYPAVYKILSELAAAAENAFKYFTNDFSLSEVWIGWLEDWKYLLEETKKLFTGQFSAQRAAELLVGDLVPGVGFNADKSLDETDGALAAVLRFFRDQTMGGGGSLGSLSPSPSGVAPSRGAGKGVTVNSPITVNVPPGTPPEAVGKEVRTGVKEGLRSVLRETSRATKPAVDY